MADIYTDTQRKMLTILPMVTGSLSVLGSSGIMYMLYLRGEKRLYHRLMFGVSLFDIVSSCNLMLSTLPVLRETGVFLARGNTASCTAQGFFAHLSFITAFYNVSLMLAFVWMVRYEWREEDISMLYERYMHLFSICVPLILGFLGIGLEMYNPVANIGFLRCFVAAYPPDCDIMDDVECTRGANARIFLGAGALLPAVATVVCLLGCAFLIWWTVRQNQRRCSRHSEYSVHNTSRQVAVQSLIYGMVFFNTYVWLLIDPIADTILPSNEITNFRVAVRFLSEFFYTSQGSFNFFVFVRPRFMRIRKRRMDKSIVWAFREAIAGNKLEDARYNPQGSGSGSGQQHSTYRWQTSTFLSPFRSFKSKKSSDRLDGPNARQVGSTSDPVRERFQDETASFSVSQSDRIEHHDGGTNDTAGGGTPNTIHETITPGEDVDDGANI